MRFARAKWDAAEDPSNRDVQIIFRPGARDAAARRAWPASPGGCLTCDADALQLE